MRSLGIVAMGVVSGGSEGPNPERPPLPVAKARKNGEGNVIGGELLDLLASVSSMAQPLRASSVLLE